MKRARGISSEWAQEATVGVILSAKVWTVSEGCVSGQARGEAALGGLSGVLYGLVSAESSTCAGRDRVRCMGETALLMLLLRL